jgi:glycosyltransferase involved in cell wall biosynthesis
VLAGNAALAFHRAAGWLRLHRALSSSFYFYATRSLNYVPTSHVRSRRCDVLFAHEYFPANLDCRTIPIVYETQLLPEVQLAAYGMAAGARQRELRLKRFCASRSSLVCVRDPAAADLARGLIPEACDRVRVVPWYLPYLEPAADPLAKHRDESTSCRVLFVGNDARRKGLPQVLAAVERLDPPQRNRIALTVVSRFLDGSIPIGSSGVRVLSDLDQHAVLELMREAHALVLPTRADTFGMVLVEALAQGCAVVSSEQDPQRWILDGGRAGCVVDPANVAELARALSELVASPARRLELARAGHERFLSTFHHRVVGAQYRAVFEEARALANV